jgi:hypothetical protein
MDDLSAATSFQAWEKQASEAWASLIRSPDFLLAMSQQLESSLLLKQQLGQALGAHGSAVAHKHWNRNRYCTLSAISKVDTTIEQRWIN